MPIHDTTPDEIEKTPRLHDSGLIERFRLDDTFVWSLTSTAINYVLDAETALQKLVHEIAKRQDVLVAYTAGIGLLYDLSLQTDVDGVWIAIDHAQQVVGFKGVDDRDALALAAVTTADDEDVDTGLEQAMFAIASHPDPALRQRLLPGLVRYVRREGRVEELQTVAQFLKGIA